MVLQSIKFEQFKIQAGSDFTGVATDMITMNSTVKMIYRNTGTFFGVHVSSTPIDLSYSQITIASGTVSLKYPSKSMPNLNIYSLFNLLRWCCADEKVLSIKKKSENSFCCGDG